MLRLLTIFVLLIVTSGTTSAQEDGITIVTPVTGDFAFLTPDYLGILDTQTGNITTLPGTIPAVTTEPLYWNNSGSKIVYIQSSWNLAWYDLDTQLLETRDLPSNDVIYLPVGWANNGDDILILGVSEANPYPLRTLSLYRYTVTNNQVETLRTYNTQTPIADIPNLQGQTPYDTFSSLTNVRRNPVFSDWIVGDYHSTDDETNLVVHNLVTNQTTQISPLFPDENIRTTLIRWSPDGTKLIIETLKFSTGQRFIHIMEFDGIGDITLKSTAEYDLEISAPAGWLGVDDIFIRSGLDSPLSDTAVYFLNQIIDGTLYTQEFFTVDNDIIASGRKDFYLRADETEQHQLSCLFDQALPTQFGIGVRARTRTTLNLYSNPDLDSNALAQLPEATEFDIIGGKACVNADSYYRFWQIELDDGTIGWAAEANLTDYFMEPVQ